MVTPDLSAYGHAGHPYDPGINRTAVLMVAGGAMLGLTIVTGGLAAEGFAALGLATTVGGTLSPVPTVTSKGIRIPYYYAGKGPVFHEMGHILDDIAHPGLLEAEKSLSYAQIVAAERTASIVQLGNTGWRTTVIPHIAAIEAKTHLVSATTWGVVGYAGYRMYNEFSKDRR